MSADRSFTKLARRDWLIDGPLENVVTSYIDALRQQRYADRTISSYLGCLAHFSFWIKGEAVELANVDSLLVKRFLLNHLPACTCPVPCYGAVANSGAALRHLLKMLPHERPMSVAANPIAVELEQFGDYLTNTCGVAQITRERRVKDVSAFLVQIIGTQATCQTGAVRF